MSDLRVLIEMLAFRNMTVSVALDGERGYKQATMLAPRLILLDVRMPDDNGFDVCRRLKENKLTQSIPVIFVTVANDLEERLEGFAAGGVDYIAKPFEVQEVLARIGVHLTIRGEAGACQGDTALIGQTESVHGRDQFLVMRAQHLLLDAIKNPPDLETLASMLGVNRRRLNDCFQAICGQPVFGWLREERLRADPERLDS